MKRDQWYTHPLCRLFPITFSLWCLVRSARFLFLGIAKGSKIVADVYIAIVKSAERIISTQTEPLCVTRGLLSRVTERGFQIDQAVDWVVVLHSCVQQLKKSFSCVDHSCQICVRCDLLFLRTFPWFEYITICYVQRCERFLRLFVMLHFGQKERKRENYVT